ncbi:hypothetical protein MBLNU457_5879t1 [Dothideomycetes sp. NU457]
MFTLVLIISLLAAVVACTCECGYTVNSTSSPACSLFTEAFETDFLHLRDLANESTVSDDPKKATGWVPQAYNTTPSDARGEYGKSMMLSNLVTNPVPNMSTWGGQGSDPGLQLWVRQELVPLSGTTSEMVSGAEIASTRDDMLYGSFRVGAKFSSVNGTCGAFFFYRNDSSEIDFEYLSRLAPAPGSGNNTSPMNIVVQSPESVNQGFNAAGTPGFELVPMAFLAAEGYHEYRFDWLPDRIDFYIDGSIVWTRDSFVPDGPGRLIMNHWSNGNQGWSGGPPAEDAVMTVSYVKAYFNTTNTTRTAQWSGACANNWENKTCELPDQTMSIDPTGPIGNQTGHTLFFSQQPGGEVNQTVYPGATVAVSEASRPSKHPLNWNKVMGYTLLASFSCFFFGATIAS